jgi:hypothetical protein
MVKSWSKVRYLDIRKRYQNGTIRLYQNKAVEHWGEARYCQESKHHMGHSICKVRTAILGRWSAS